MIPITGVPPEEESRREVLEEACGDLVGVLLSEDSPTLLAEAVAGKEPLKGLSEIAQELLRIRKITHRALLDTNQRILEYVGALLVELIPFPIMMTKILPDPDIELIYFQFILPLHPGFDLPQPCPADIVDMDRTEISNHITELIVDDLVDDLYTEINAFLARYDSELSLTYADLPDSAYEERDGEFFITEASVLVFVCNLTRRRLRSATEEYPKYVFRKLLSIALADGSRKEFQSVCFADGEAAEKVSIVTVKESLDPELLAECGLEVGRKYLVVDSRIQAELSPVFMRKNQAKDAIDTVIHAREGEEGALEELRELVSDEEILAELLEGEDFIPLIKVLGMDMETFNEALMELANEMINDDLDEPD